MQRSPAEPRSRRAIVAWVAAWLVLTAILLVSLGAVEWPRVLAALREVRPGWAFVAVVANTLLLASWAGLWRVIVAPGRRPPYGRMFEIVSVTSAVMNTTPMYLGHVSGFALLVRRGGVDAPTAAGVFAVDQLAEGISKAGVLLLASAVIPLPQWMRDGLRVVSGGVLVLLVVLLALAHRLGDGPPPGAHPLRARLARWARELDSLRSWRRAGGALLFTGLTRLAELAGIVAAQRAMGLDLPLAFSVAVLGAVLLGTMLPLSPGNLGTYEAAAYVVYRQAGVAPEQALAVAIVQHVVLLVPTVGVGYLMLSRHGVAGAVRALSERGT